MVFQGPEKAAPAIGTDSTREVRSAPMSGRSLLEFPTTTAEHKEWSAVFQKQRNGFAGEADNDLPGVELFSPKQDKHDTLVAGRGGNRAVDHDGNGIDDVADRERLAAVAGRRENLAADRDGDGIRDNIDGPSSAVQKRLDELQEKERDYHHERHTETMQDINETAGGEANKHSYEWHFLASNSSIKEQKLKEFSSRLSHVQVGRTSFGQDSEMLAQALSGSLTSNFQPHGFDLPPSVVSINELKIEEREGRVLLTSPEGIAVVKPDGKPLSAMELPKYLRPDGTLLLGEYGQALGPGDGNDGRQSFAINNIASLDLAGYSRRSSGKNLVSDKTEENFEPPLRPPETLVAESDLPLTDTKIKDTLEQATNNTSQLNLEALMPGNKITDDASNPELLTEDDKTGDKTYKTRLGETLRSIALTNRNLNDLSLWPLLAEKNNLSTNTDAKGVPIEVLQRGTVLTLPNASDIEAFRAQQMALNKVSPFSNRIQV